MHTVVMLLWKRLVKFLMKLQIGKFETILGQEKVVNFTFSEKIDPKASLFSQFDVTHKDFRGNQEDPS